MLTNNTMKRTEPRQFHIRKEIVLLFILASIPSHVTRNPFFGSLYSPSRGVHSKHMSSSYIVGTHPRGNVDSGCLTGKSASCL